MEKNIIYLGDAQEGVKHLPDKSVDCVVTSPPYYGLRDYGMDAQIGLEESPSLYIGRLVSLFQEIRRVLKDDGTLWVNLGDSYAGSGKGFCADGTHSEGGKQSSNKGAVTGNLKKTEVKGCKSKDLIGIPWRFAFAMQEDGWYLRQDIIWHKPNPMPESVTDRCTKAHEYIFLFSKMERYYFDSQAIQEEAVTQVDPRIGKRVDYDGMRKGQEGTGNRAFVSLKTSEDGVVVRNKRDVWSVNLKPNKEAHFATYPEELIVPCILAGCPEGGVVLDPFMGSGTTGIVARKLNRNYVGCELNPTYKAMAERRINNEGENLFNQA
jgi:DNA modification methylase